MTSLPLAPRWFSARGARRGVFIALWFASAWLAWAVGFTQGASAAPEGQASEPPAQAHPHPQRSTQACPRAVPSV